MFSKAFMEFLIKYQDKIEDHDEETTKMIEFKPVKVTEAAKVVITAIKDSY